MAYVLENTAEARRLKLQDDISVYSLNHDLKDLKITSKDKVLDAGCGAGIVSLFLKKNYEMHSLESCDFSDIRLKQAEKYLVDNNAGENVSYFQCDLERIPKNDHSYDKIVCRFVYEYLPNPLKVTQELHRLCKPGGVVRLIDLDGVVANLHTNNSELRDMLILLTKKAYEDHHLDFYAGRKLFAHMKGAGFKDVSYQVRPMAFHGEDLLKEVENYRERFNFGRALLDSVFGSPKMAQRFIDAYLEELTSKDSLLFYNNFIVTGSK
ncbi:class I SAM-dependent methyltransferase [Peredibacter sp. HCB2-198]|uniref:class I SAM-dependent methyltransferase n=1 Tax=Peredibacter sp. HCB2-198 TaxID=3383025 RepID=UPI0038B4443B